MSRAFVKENDDAVPDLAERAVSAAPNLVTAAGLAAIEANIAACQAQLAALTADQAHERALAARDLRYWTSRRASARLVSDSVDHDQVRFGSRIEICRSDGRVETYAIVGEDEADPEQHSIAYTSPIARALLGKGAGESVRINGDDIELVSIGARHD